MQCMAPSQAPPAAAPCVPVGGLCESCHLHHFATLLDPFGIFLSLLDSFDSLCYLLLQTHVKHHARWADDGGSQHDDMEGSAHWHSDTLGASLGAGAFAAPFASQTTMKSQDVSDYEDANCELSMQPIRTGLCVAVWHVLCGCSVAWNWNPWRRITRGLSSQAFHNSECIQISDFNVLFRTSDFMM